jgi:thioredoxin reductase
VFDDDGTWMHKAHLFNYLGIGSLDGTAFVETARTQVDGFGVERRQGEAVTDVAKTDGGFRVSTEDGGQEADSLVLATGATGASPTHWGVRSTATSSTST